MPGQVRDSQGVGAVVTTHAPAAIQSPFDLGDINPDVTVLQGEGILRRGRQSLALAPCRVFASSRPTWGLRFEGEGESNDSIWLERAFERWAAPRIEFSAQRARGRLYEETVEVGGDLTSMPFRMAANGSVREVVVGTARKLKSVVFHLPNFVHFIGTPITQGSGWWRGRIELDDGEWRVTVDQRRDFGELKNRLGDEGGYAITHLCRVDKRGARFSTHDVKELIGSLHWFLSFVRGAWTSPCLIVGEPAWRKTQWHDIVAGRTDRWSGSFTWCDPYSWKSVNEAYRGYLTLWRKPEWRQGLRTAIGLFITANRPNPLEVAIIAAQSGLELLGWLTFVETNLVATDDWRNASRYPAHRKIRELLTKGKIEPSIPRELSTLAQLDANWTDGPDAIAGVRNRLVHPRRAEGTVAWPTEVLRDAWLLSSRYLELVLLHALGVTSEIRDRLGSPWVGATVKPPWV